MNFLYSARSADGTILHDALEAPSRETAIDLLRKEGYVPLSLAQKKAGIFSAPLTSSKHVSLTERILFAKNLSGMLAAGLPISRALTILERQTQNQYFKSVIEKLLGVIDSGKPLSDGLAQFPHIFSNLFVAMVRAGEESGNLPSVLTEIQTALEKTYALNRKIKSALMYPSIILCAIVLIAILMFIYVVPTLTKTFKELGVELPGTTRFVIFISDMVTGHLLLVVAALAAIGGLLYAMTRVPKLKRKTDWIVLRIPVIKTITIESNTARTVRTLASLLAAGVPISRALTITKAVLQNHYYKAVLERTERAVESGAAISSVFQKEQHLYPIMVGEMIAVGEETGKLGPMLSDIAVFYENEVDARTKDLSTIVEPVLMIFIGAAVGFFAVSMLSPMYSILDAIK